jgi:transposase
MVVKVREAHERRMRDAQAAELLPLGRGVAAERLGVAPSTVYKMVHRFRRDRSTAGAAA